MMRRKWDQGLRQRIGVLAASVASISAAPVHATVAAGSATYAVAPGICQPTITSHSPLPLRAEAHCAEEGGLDDFHAIAVAGPGHLGLSVVAASDPRPTLFYNDTASASVSFRFEVVPTRPTALSAVPVALNLLVNGHLQGQANPVSNGPAASAFWRLNGGINTSSFDILTSVGQHSSHSESGIGFSSGGELITRNEDTIAGMLTTTPVLVAVGDPTAFAGLQLFANGNTTQGVPATIDMLNSLDFPHGRDVFTVPDGFTVNAPDVFIFNNRFLPPGAVPEPATWGTMLLGLALAGAALRRRAIAGRAATHKRGPRYKRTPGRN